MSYEKIIIDNTRKLISQHQESLKKAEDLAFYHREQINVLQNNLNFLNVKKEKKDNINFIRKATIAAIEKFELKHGKINYEENYLVRSYE